MKIFIFEGASDDTFGEYLQISDSYDNCGNGMPIRYKLHIEDGSGIIITGCYAHKDGLGDGCWMIGVENIDEENPVDWPCLINPGYANYRGQLSVHAPDDATLTCLNREK